MRNKTHDLAWLFLVFILLDVADWFHNLSWPWMLHVLPESAITVSALWLFGWKVWDRRKVAFEEMWHRQHTGG